MDASKEPRKNPPPDYAPPTVVPVGMRADRTGPLGVPVPDMDSVVEEQHWVQEHQM
ncbi:MAG: hypothetical protein VB086_08935 [Clostridiaceae bacterium]|nr:hypothetical protein [Clostridiaceae bacterium]